MIGPKEDDGLGFLEARRWAVAVGDDLAAWERVVNTHLTMLAPSSYVMDAVRRAGTARSLREVTVASEDSF